MRGLTVLLVAIQNLLVRKESLTTQLSIDSYEIQWTFLHNSPKEPTSGCWNHPTISSQHSEENHIRQFD
ncbi:hypothetical protein NPIL_410501 [Nephila pilipes]|uniref:Uncharacterized protein n=1 Tax=Nephila pilipes TaxID=299642 RepID=A0A8X6PST2_NEPPI|nr:hypothetical protein NPIL_410501 [Nephila pilipes]